MRWRARASDGSARHSPHRFDQARTDDCGRRDEFDEPLPALVARGERLGQQVLDIEDLGPAFAHPGDELVVLVLRSLDPQDVVEQELVVVAWG